MTATRQKQQLTATESAGEIPPPASELIEVANAVLSAAGALSKLRATIRSTEQEYRQTKAAAVDAQHRHDRSQGLIGLAERVSEVNVTRLALERAEAQLCEAQRLLPDAEAELAKLDARHRTMACELIKRLRASAARRYRCAAEDLKNARNLYTDLGLVLGEPDWHASSIVLWDLESRIDLMYQVRRPAPPFLVEYAVVRKALAEGRRR